MPHSKSEWGRIDHTNVPLLAGTAPPPVSGNSMRSVKLGFIITTDSVRVDSWQTGQRVPTSVELDPFWDSVTSINDLLTTLKKSIGHLQIFLERGWASGSANRNYMPSKP